MPREEGFYWVRVWIPQSDGGGITHETSRGAEIAEYRGIDWYVVDVAGPVADALRVEVLSERRVLWDGRT
ncbi:MAG TPA: hypothetical protein VGK73_03915 [Polyangiaceae bacterium]